MSRTNNEKLIKVVFAGETSVGKTSIIERYLTDRISDHAPTVGASFASKKVNYNGKTLMLGIWDTAGQERYQSLSSIYFRQASICILVFDITNRESFNKIAMWKKLCTESNGDTPIYILVGNKLDMNGRMVERSHIDSFCQENNIAHYIETSAYTGTGIKILYQKIAEEACDIKLPSITKKLTISPVHPETKHDCKCYK